MVGDRSYDVAGAKAHGLACIGAGWGYGEPGELQSAGAVAVCSSPAEVVTMVRR
jgi:phosphoglycolate phosphatase